MSGPPCALARPVNSSQGPDTPVRAAIALLALTLLAPSATAQDDPSTANGRGNGGLQVFLDCDQGCDFDFIRQEILFINWVRDRLDGDVHLLVTRQGTGGGIEYQLQFIGMKGFDGQDQTLLFNSSRTDTDDERRRGFARIVRLGLARYIAQTSLATYADVVVDTPVDDEGVALPVLATTPEDDPWNYWVFSVGVEGRLEEESRQSENEIEVGVTASRVTDAWKVRIEAEGEYSEADFQFEDGSNFKNVVREFDGGGSIVKSLGDHWGAGVGASVRQSTFFNLSPSYRTAAALEYNIYPYPESSQRQLTFTYFLGVNRFNYEETTIFEKMSETLLDHGAIVSLDLERPWGSAGVDLEVEQFLQHLDEFAVELRGNLEYRILRGLSIDLFGGIESIRNQRYLPLEGSSDEEVLLQRRALATDFRYFGGFGIRYTFGSIFNNVVNARLSRNRSGFHTIY